MSSVRFPDARLLVFAKAPRPGRVKTRLQPVLGAHGAARLHERLLRDTVIRFHGAGLCTVELWCTPDAGHPVLQRLGDELGVALRVQHGGDLGERMYHALAAALQVSTYAVVVGCDSPSLTAAHLCEALDRLRQGMDAVIGPARDGGYVLLGVRHCDRALFHGIPWGTDVVVGRTRAALRRLGWRWHELPMQWDVDRPEDLSRLNGTMTSGQARRDVS